MIQILDLGSKAEVRELELRVLETQIADPMEREIFSWNAPWREESLNHYLATGWSAGIRDKDGRLIAYFLAQPLLFFRGLTQVLWVEHVCAPDPQHREQLLDIATRYSREKHLQSVFVRQEPLADLEIKTTKR